VRQHCDSSNAWARDANRVRIRRAGGGAGDSCKGGAPSPTATAAAWLLMHTAARSQSRRSRRHRWLRATCKGHLCVMPRYHSAQRQWREQQHRCFTHRQPQLGVREDRRVIALQPRPRERPHNTSTRTRKDRTVVASQRQLVSEAANIPRPHLAHRSAIPRWPIVATCARM
jgi:hypothetical protein